MFKVPRKLMSNRHWYAVSAFCDWLSITVAKMPESIPPGAGRIDGSACSAEHTKLALVIAAVFEAKCFAGTTIGNIKGDKKCQKEGAALSKNMNRYIFRARLKSGNYVVRAIRGSSGMFPIRGRFLVPLHCDIEVKKGEVVNLGKIVARTRKRQEGELRAGPIFPLIDQSVTGFSEATFDVSPLASQNEDMNTMKTLFPALRTARIVEKTLLPFNREVAQKWWDKQP